MSKYVYVVATRLLEGIGEDRENGYAERPERKRAFIVGGLGERNNRIGLPARVYFHFSERIAEDIAEQPTMNHFRQRVSFPPGKFFAIQGFGKGSRDSGGGTSSHWVAGVGATKISDPQCAVIRDDVSNPLVSGIGHVPCPREFLLRCQPVGKPFADFGGFTEGVFGEGVPQLTNASAPKEAQLAVAESVPHEPEEILGLGGCEPFVFGHLDSSIGRDPGMSYNHPIITVFPVISTCSWECGSKMSDWGQAIDRYVDEIADELQEVRQYLHANPEPSGKEYQTTKLFSRQLELINVPHRVISSQRGIIADAAGYDGVARVAMRGDMDALLIHDEKRVAYRSRNEGVMHACGHDAHSTMILGAVKALVHVANKLPWPCPWRAIFQPAEETGEGALEMIAEGAVENTRALVAFHVDPERPVGQVGSRHGEMTACCQEFDITIKGHGGHAARPHHSTDPIAAAIHFVSDVYQMIPRVVDSRIPVVVTFGVIRGGENPNVIPEQVLLRGTARTLTDEAGETVRRFLAKLARCVEDLTETTIEIEFFTGPDAVVNDPRVTDTLNLAAADVVGSENVHHIPQPSMGGEDFAAYGKKVPTSLMRLGVASEFVAEEFLHSPRFDIDERALAIGVKILARAMVLLAKP